MQVECVLDCACTLGEGPYYDRAGERLIFVDIMGKTGHILAPGSGRHETIDFPEVVSAVIPRASGGYIATLESRVVTVGKDGALTDFAKGYRRARHPRQRGTDRQPWPALARHHAIPAEPGWQPW